MKLYRYLFLLGLAGCMVGPNYEKPDIGMPEKFNENIHDAPCSDEDLCQWWKQFEDPLLDTLIEEAATANYDLRIALEQIATARAQYKIKTSYLWPEIDLTATAIRQRFSQNVFTTATAATSVASGTLLETPGISGNPTLGPAVQNFFQAGFDAVWELDFWGKFRRGKKAAFDTWEATKFTAQNVLLTVISEVARDYISIRALQKEIELINKKIDADLRQLQLAQVLFDAGLDNQIDVENFTAALDADKAELPLLESSLKQGIYALAVLLGRQPEGLTEMFEEAGPIPEGSGKVPGGLPSDLLRRRPDIRASERQLAAATEQIGVQVADLFPHISLTGDSFGYEANKQYKWFIPSSKYWNIGPSINWDLIDFGRTFGQINVTKSIQRQALLRYEQAVITALQDVEGALVAYFEEQKRNFSLADQAAATKRSLYLNEVLFKAGLVAESAVLAAEINYINSETSLVQSAQALTSDLVALYKALGGEWECSSTP
jgi:NodT family efflux transporter outer membrane factor (OMF) lipoprotein